MTNGQLIVFEGADEVGKTTLATMLADKIRSTGGACKLMGFPGNQIGTLGRHINELHHNPAKYHVARINPASLQLLHVAAHIDAIDQEIVPALKGNQTIILDRFWWSTWIYGNVNGANKNSLATAIRAEKIHWKGIRPSRVFLITRHSPFKKQADLFKWKRIDRLYRRFAQEQKTMQPVTMVQNDSTLAAAFSIIQKFFKRP